MFHQPAGGQHGIANGFRRFGRSYGEAEEAFLRDFKGGRRGDIRGASQYRGRTPLNCFSSSDVVGQRPREGGTHKE